ncbi:MAG: 50S ribosomal protein L28 [bacterium]
MANACDLCGKKRDVGHNVSHAKNRTQRIRKPNLHAHRMQMGESKLRLRLCTKCLRSVKAASQPASSKSEKSVKPVIG